MMRGHHEPYGDKKMIELVALERRIDQLELLPEPEERVRELHDDEAAAFDDAMRADYGPFFDFVRPVDCARRNV
jgi:hypothetical protein